MDKETAMKILKELYDNSLSAERTALKTIIPELKESKDERIKSVILKALLTDEAINILIECGIYYEDVESWLEKQGECCTGEADDGALEQQFQIWFEKGNVLEGMRLYFILKILDCKSRASRSLRMFIVKNIARVIKK